MIVSTPEPFIPSFLLLSPSFPYFSHFHLLTIFQDRTYILNSISTMQGKRFEMFNLRSEQVKFNAFFQYLKSFSEAGLDTLQKLENEFNKEMRKKLKHCETLSTIKNLLSSYEIFILQIKDSCDFVEISEFGYCIGKTFLQLLKIIKWFLKSWLKDTRKFQKVKANLQSDAGDEPNANQQNLCAFCEELIKTTPYGRQMKGKRKGVAINDLGSEMRDAKLTHKRQVTHLMQMKENVLDRYTQKEIGSRKNIGDLGEIDILNRKHIAMKLQISNNQMVLEEVLNEFSIKTEAMSRFVSNTQANCIEDFKMNQESDYLQFQEQMRATITQKYNEARDKLKALVTQRITDYEKHRREKLVDREIQTMAQDYSQKEKNQSKIKQLNAACLKLKNQLQSEKALNQSLKQLLQSKSVEFQTEFLNYRKDVIKSDVKSRHYLKSLKSFKSGMEEGIEQEDEKDQTASIKLQESNEINHVRRQISKVVSGSLKDKDKVRNRFSIKFTLEEGQQNDENDDCINQESQVCKFTQLTREVSIQTEAICIIDDARNFESSSTYFPQHEKQQAKSLFKELRNNKVISQKGLPKKSQTQLYAHVKSKVVNMLQKQTVRSVRRDFKQSRSSCMGDLVKKLSVDYLFPKRREPTTTDVKLFKIQQPSFQQVVTYFLSKDDILNLFLSQKNAHNYQCLIYRNSLFNLANVNQKRVINLSKQIQSSDLQFLTKKESAVNDSVQTKIIHAFHHQLACFKKREKHIYEQLKQLLRSPYQLSKKVEVIQLQGELDSKDIEVSQLKRMMNIILKFHGDCIGEERDCVCEHIVNFSQRIGIRFI